MKVESIELDHDGIRELLRSDETKQICKQFTDRAAEQLGEGFESEGYTGKERVNARLNAVTVEALRKNQKDNRMIKAVLIK